MYLWKCIREFGALVLVAIVTMGGVMIWATQQNLNYLANELNRSGLPHWEEAFSGRHDILIMDMALLVLGGCALSICIGTIGGIAREFDDRRSDLLFSHPALRRRLLWTNWLCGLAAIESALLFCALLAALHGYLYLRIHTAAPQVSAWALLLLGEQLRTLLLMLPVNMLIMGIATLAGVAFRGASAGTMTAAALVGVDLVVWLPPFSRYWMSLPSWWVDRLAIAIHLTPGTAGAFPYALVLGWTAAALLFPFAAQLVLERRDVA